MVRRPQGGLERPEQSSPPQVRARVGHDLRVELRNIPATQPRILMYWCKNFLNKLLCFANSTRTEKNAYEMSAIITSFDFWNANSSTILKKYLKFLPSNLSFCGGAELVRDNRFVIRSRLSSIALNSESDWCCSTVHWPSTYATLASW